MHLRNFLLSALPLFSLVPSTNALLGLNLNLLGLTKLDLDVGLLQNGALVNVDAFANVLGTGSCPSANVGVQAAVLGLVKACVCVNLLHNGLLSGKQACPSCPANATPICGGAKCGCACVDGFFSDHASGTCLPKQTCISSGGALLNYNDGTSSCQCTSPLQATGMGSCALPPSARARRHRRDFATRQHHARRAQNVFRPATSEALTKTPALKQDVVSSEHCPTGETACPLSSGGVECIDTTASLTSCGGCVGDSSAGTNCLSIPGALHVECRVGQCQVASCFKGWSFLNGRCI